MSIRQAGLDIPTLPTPVGPAEGAEPAAPVADAGDAGKLAPGPRDGVDRATSAEARLAVPGQLTTPDAKTLTGAVGVADVLRELAGGKLAADPGLRSLPTSTQERILAAAKNGPATLLDTLKRLANSPQFRKLSPDVQGKIVSLLSKVAGNPKESQAIERLVRSGSFAALPEKEQMKLLANIDKANDAPAAREKAEESSSRAGPGNLLGGAGEAASAAALLQMAPLVDPTAVPADPSANPLPIDRDGSGSKPAGAPDPGAPYHEIKRVIAQLRAAPELSAASVAQLLGAPLAPVPATPDSAGIWTAYEGQLAAGPFRRVELRESTTLPWRLVSLEVRPPLEVAYNVFRGDLIPAAIEPHLNPDIGPDGELSYRVTDERPRQDIRFGFGARVAHLLSASIHRHFE
jgi:hypothetical protein